VSEVEAGREKVSLFELAWTFNHIALASFGGGLSAWSREVLAEGAEISDARRCGEGVRAADGRSDPGHVSGD
jgi:hypothetical protein